MKRLKIGFFSIVLLVLICLTGCKNDDSSQNISKNTSTQDITVLTEVSPTDTTAISSYDNSDKNTNDSVSKNEDTVTTTSIKNTEINQNTDTMKTTETSMTENQSVATTTKTGTSSPSYEKKESDSIITTYPSNSTIHKTETTTVTLPDNEEQVTHKRDENELPDVDPFA